MKLLFTIFLSSLTFIAYGQFDPKIEAYKHFSIHKNKDTINYHIYAENGIENSEGLIMFIHGSAPTPLFTINRQNNFEKITGNVPFDLNKLPKNFAFVLVSKKCIPFSVVNQDFKVPKCFYENESLNYRVWQTDEVLNDILKKHIKKPTKVIVIGHSEGSDVVAKLGTINKKITHIGYWAGGANAQYFDFVVFVRKDVLKGNITEEEAMSKIDSLAAKFKEIEANRNSITKFWEDNTYKKWANFSEPTINNLLKINIPIFVAVGTNDESVPVESSYLILTEFIRNKKNNLTFKVYPYYDHSFQRVPQSENEEWEQHWMTVFDDFIKWTE